MGLFQLGEFVLHSGATSRVKIDCDALTDDDIACLAFMLSERLPPFCSVEGIPEGGLRLAKALRSFAGWGGGNHLIVDDVLTTGSGMVEARKKYPGAPVIGAVLFARGPCPDWIVPLFRMEPSCAP